MQNKCLFFFFSLMFVIWPQSEAAGNWGKGHLRTTAAVLQTLSLTANSKNTNNIKQTIAPDFFSVLHNTNVLPHKCCSQCVTQLLPQSCRSEHPGPSQSHLSLSSACRFDPEGWETCYVSIHTRDRYHTQIISHSFICITDCSVVHSYHFWR